MRDHAQIIKELGGYAKLAEVLGLPRGTVSAMKSRKSIPADRWSAIAKEATLQGKGTITIDLLAALRPKRRKVLQRGQ